MVYFMGIQVPRGRGGFLFFCGGRDFLVHWFEWIFHSALAKEKHI